MNIVKKIILIFILILTAAAPVQGADQPAVQDFLINSDSGNSLIMGSASIKLWNTYCKLTVPTADSFSAYGSSIDGSLLKNKIKSLSAPSAYSRYSENGMKLTQSYYSNIMDNINMTAIKNQNTIRYALAVKRSYMKKFPTDDMAFSSTSSSLDRFMETTVYPGEPLAVLWESKDGKWLFSKMYNYEAWIKKENVAFTSKEVAKLYAENKSFIVVTEPKAFSKKYNLELDMGTRLPLIKTDNGNYKVFIPHKNYLGRLRLLKDNIGAEKASKGYLPYTTNNIINQSFKFLGEPYGWGGMNGTRDCSAFVMDVFRSMGIYMPRNTDEQEISPGVRSSLSNSKPGSLLYMNGHVAIYLGTYNDEEYIIHDTPGYYVLNQNRKKYIKTDGVVATPLDIHTSKTSYRKAIRTSLFIK